MAKLDKELFESLKFNDSYQYVTLPTKVANMIKRQYKKNGRIYVLVSFIKKTKIYNSNEWEETMFLGYFSVVNDCASRGPSIAHTVNGCNVKRDWTQLANELLSMDNSIAVKHK